LEELEGKLPADKPGILSAIRRFFELSAVDRIIFRLGRRSGALRKLDDLADKETYSRLKSVVDHYATEGGNLEEDIIKTMNNYI